MTYARVYRFGVQIALTNGEIIELGRVRKGPRLVAYGKSTGNDKAIRALAEKMFLQLGELTGQLLLVAQINHFFKDQFLELGLRIETKSRRW